VRAHGKVSIPYMFWFEGVGGDGGCDLRKDDGSCVLTLLQMLVSFLILVCLVAFFSFSGFHHVLMNWFPWCPVIAANCHGCLNVFVGCTAGVCSQFFTLTHKHGCAMACEDCCGSVLWEMMGSNVWTSNLSHCVCLVLSLPPIFDQ
jgi:hypothetical protein